MSASESTATPHRPTSPSAIGWSESMPRSVGMSNAVDSPSPPALMISLKRQLVWTSKQIGKSRHPVYGNTPTGGPGSRLAPTCRTEQPALMQPIAGGGAQDCVLCAENTAADRGEDPWAVAQLSTGVVRLNPTQWFRGATFFVSRTCVAELHQLPRSIRVTHLMEMSGVA